MKIAALAALAAALFVSTGWNGPKRIAFTARIRGTPASNYRAVVTANAGRSGVERRVDSLLALMTLREKVDQLHGNAHKNKPLITDLLKDEWGLRGFEVSDWEGTKSTVASANAGHDVEMPQGPYFSDALLAAVNGGQVSEETLDDKVRRVLRTKAWSGVLDEPVLKYEESVNSAQHKALALECAQKSLVLARNQGGILPLSKTNGSVALIGPGVDWARGGGHGSSTVTPLHIVTPREGIAAAIGSQRITADYANADAAIVFIAVALDGEFGDRCANTISQSTCSSDIREFGGSSGNLPLETGVEVVTD